jgi:MoaD family protein
MKTVSIRYFALLRDRAGKAEEGIQTESATLADLYDELRIRYSFTLGPNDVKASVNGQWADLQSPFQDQDQIVFIPPVAGG